MTTWREDQLAYDGSSAPLKRELTPLERDILTRILEDIKHQIIQFVNDGSVITGGEPIILSSDDLHKALRFHARQDGMVTGIRMNLTEVQMVFDLIDVINPRTDT